MCYPSLLTRSIFAQSIGSSETKVHNARSIAAHSRSLSSVKLWYYTVFAALYGFCGRRAAAVMVNSSWTQGHINSIWRISDRTTVVYPPVNVAEFQSFALEERAPLIVSIGQFRPEKVGLRVVTPHCSEQKRRIMHYKFGLSTACFRCTKELTRTTSN